MSLRDKLVQILSKDASATKPQSIDQGTILWSPPRQNHRFFHVREDADVVVTWSVRTGPLTKPPPPMASETAATIARFLASISEQELALPTSDRPLRRIDQARLSLPFEAFAIAHPSLNPKASPGELERMLVARSYTAFPCFTCEVADEMDATWASFHYRRWNHSRLERTPHPAVRIHRFPRPQGKPGKPKARAPYELVEKNPITRVLNAREWIDVENWRNRVVRFADGNVSVLPDGLTRPIAGRNDAIAIEEAFLTGDRIPETALAPDPLPQSQSLGLGMQFEATARDVVDGIEPVEILELATERTVLRLWLGVDGTTMTGSYEIADDRLDVARVVELFTVVYLGWFTKDYWRKSVATIVLAPKGNPSARRTFPYPPPKEPKARR